jgi:hypothetical protein
MTPCAAVHKPYLETWTYEETWALTGTGLVPEESCCNSLKKPGSLSIPDLHTIRYQNDISHTPSSPTNPSDTNIDLTLMHALQNTMATQESNWIWITEAAAFTGDKKKYPAFKRQLWFWFTANAKTTKTTEAKVLTALSYLQEGMAQTFANDYIDSHEDRWGMCYGCSLQRCKMNNARHNRPSKDFGRGRI